MLKRALDWAGWQGDSRWQRIVLGMKSCIPKDAAWDNCGFDSAGRSARFKSMLWIRKWRAVVSLAGMTDESYRLQDIAGRS
jgi:hypothetical protein